MILTCPACGTRYSADPASLGPNGRVVRCAKCDQTWMQPPPDDLPRQLEVPPTPLALTEEPPGPPLLRYGGAVLLIAVLLAVAALAYWGRGWIAARFPALKPFYELAGLSTEPIGAGLAIENVVFSRQTGGDSALTIQGNVVNRSDRPQAAPMLRAILSNDNGKPLLQQDFGLDKTMLVPGEIASFQTVVKNPPPMFRKLAITFAGR